MNRNEIGNWQQNVQQRGKSSWKKQCWINEIACHFPKFSQKQEEQIKYLQRICFRWLFLQMM